MIKGIEVKEIGKGNFEAFIGAAVEDIKVRLEGLGRNTVEVMKANIQAKRDGSTGTLARSITSESGQQGDTYFIGIGDKSKLPPYWYVVNYGKLFTSGKPYVPFYGKYAPLGSFGGDRPVKGGSGKRFIFDGKYAMSAKKAIMPMNYIENTVMWLRAQFSTYFK
jgi:hypothetical protein